eukprot:855820-Rhodomonas_salina.3
MTLVRTRHRTANAKRLRSKRGGYQTARDVGVCPQVLQQLSCQYRTSHGTSGRVIPSRNRKGPMMMIFAPYRTSSAVARRHAITAMKTARTLKNVESGKSSAEKASHVLASTANPSASAHAVTGTCSIPHDQYRAWSSVLQAVFFSRNIRLGTWRRASL